MSWTTNHVPLSRSFVQKSPHICDTTIAKENSGLATRCRPLNTRSIFSQSRAWEWVSKVSTKWGTHHASPASILQTPYIIRYTCLMSGYYGDSIFWVEVDRIKPNPFQPRKNFDETSLASLSESIRQYGVLQPLTVTRKEIERPGEGILVEYELIAGERRLRA